MFKDVETVWTAVSGDYDALIQRQLGDAREVSYWSCELKQLLGDQPLDVLDVGCGPGFLSIILARLGHRVKAVDGAEGMVRCAAGNFAAEGRDIAVEVADAVCLAAEQASSYDVIISRDVVWTLYDPKQAFARWREVLKPGGRVVIYDGNYRSGRRSVGYRLRKALGECLTAIRDRRCPKKRAHYDEGGVFDALPLVLVERPAADRALLSEAGYRLIDIVPDAHRNSPRRMEFWLYGYQGRKFRVVAEH